MMPTLAPPRSVVRETWGYRTTTLGPTKAGVSCAVLDRLWQWKAVAIFRSEDYGQATYAERVQLARAHAADHAAAMNERAA